MYIKNTQLLALPSLNLFKLGVEFSKSLQMVMAAMKLKDTCSLERKLLQT